MLFEVLAFLRLQKSMISDSAQDFAKS